MANWKNVFGWILDNEAPILTEHCLGKDILEIGSFEGKSSCLIAPVAKSLVCVDNFAQEEDQLEKFKENTKEFHNITIFVGDSSKIVKRKTSKEQFDVVFIDGDHTFKAVKADIEACWPKLKMGGKMIFHDCGWDGERDGGVKKAILSYFDVKEVKWTINETSIAIVEKTKDLLKGD